MCSAACADVTDQRFQTARLATEAQRGQTRFPLTSWQQV